MVTLYLLIITIYTHSGESKYTETMIPGYLTLKKCNREKQVQYNILKTDTRISSIQLECKKIRQRYK